VDRIRELLLDDGFEVVGDWLPTAIAFAHRVGRQVDVRPVELTSDGGGDQILLDGTTPSHYDAPATGFHCGTGHAVLQPGDADRVKSWLRPR
jgi:Aminoglycoside-2''-adenylyltransferase